MLIRGAGGPRDAHHARNVASLLRPWRTSLVVVAGCVIASALAELVPPFVVRFVVNHDLVARRTSEVLVASSLYLLAVAASAAFGFAYTYLAAKVSQSAIASLRVQLFTHVMTLPASYFDTTPIGEVISRSTADVEMIDELLANGIATLVGQLAALGAAAIAMIFLSPLLSAVSAVVLPPLLVVTRFLQTRVRDAQRKDRIAVGRLNAELAEVVGGVETLRAFGREAVFVVRFRQALRRTLVAQGDSVKYSSFFVPVSDLLSSVVIAILVWVGAGRTMAAAGVNLGTLTAFVLLFQSFFAPIIALGDQWQSVQAAVAGGERVFELLDLAADVLPAEAQARTCTTARIEVTKVSFGYDPARAVLNEVSLSVGPGEHVALVGRTGAGKSSLLSLIGGVYPPGSGSVRVTGVDPRAIEEDKRRAILGVVPQALQLFGGSVRENLTLFDEDIDDAAIWRVIELVGLGPLVAALPGGLDALLAGEGRGAGTVLSAGERQLVALARALVNEPAVLLLDEATAAIDSASDTALRAALCDTARRHGCATLTVAHRISTAKEADRVVVIDGGRIVEEGPPDVLAAAGGLFAALADLDAAGWDCNDISPDHPSCDELDSRAGSQETVQLSTRKK